jgi:hypothetical protein
MVLFFIITTLPKISIPGFLPVRKFWLKVIRALNMKIRKSVYQEGTAVKVVTCVDSSNVVMPHLMPAYVKELSLFSGGCVVQNANHTFIHCTWL